MPDGRPSVQADRLGPERPAGHGGRIPPAKNRPTGAVTPQWATTASHIKAAHSPSRPLAAVSPGDPGLPTTSRSPALGPHRVPRALASAGQEAAKDEERQPGPRGRRPAGRLGRTRRAHTGRPPPPRPLGTGGRSRPAGGAWTAARRAAPPRPASRSHTPALEVRELRRCRPGGSGAAARPPLRPRGARRGSAPERGGEERGEEGRGGEARPLPAGGGRLAGGRHGLAAGEAGAAVGAVLVWFLALFFPRCGAGGLAAGRGGFGACLILFLGLFNSTTLPPRPAPPPPSAVPASRCVCGKPGGAGAEG